MAGFTASNKDGYPGALKLISALKQAGIELLQQQPRALPASGERREECERVEEWRLTALA